MENQQDAPEVQETQETVGETEQTPQEAEVETLTPEQIADLKKKADASSKNYERLKKMEAELKETRDKLNSSSKTDAQLSSKDLLYLAKADIAPDDVDEVLTYANKMGVSIADAHKFYKPILAERAEERRTANATQTRGNRGSAKVSGEDLLRKAENTGEVPETADGMKAIIEARMARKRQ